FSAGGSRSTSASPATGWSAARATLASASARKVVGAKRGMTRVVAELRDRREAVPSPRRRVYLCAMTTGRDSFNTQDTLRVGGARFRIHRLDVLGERATRLPFSLKILLENLLRREDGRQVSRPHVEALLDWDPARAPVQEIPFMPARVLLQDFTGVPAIVDLAAMRDAVRGMGGDPARINPIQPADLVIDHSVQVDVFGTPDAFRRNVEIEFERNRE